MKFRTEWQKLRADPLNGAGIAVYTLILFLIIIVIDVGFRAIVGTSEGMWSRVLTPAPHVFAGSLKIGYALERWGEQLEPDLWNGRLTFLWFLLVVPYVIVPGLVIWGIRARRQWRLESSHRGFPWKIALALALGWYVAIMTCLMALAGSLMGVSVYRSIQIAQTVQTNRDALLADMNLVVSRARTAFFVPREIGGAGGSWWKDNESKDPQISLDALAPTTPMLARHLAAGFPQKPSKFLIEVTAPDTLILWGIGTEMGDEETFENKDGQRGKIQIREIVTPKGQSVEFQN
ncbi:MAG: hypothetical protein FJ217_12375 [Ignavibacteria bacterium]|nr:hypothetical protein [Ignavibacteria bacterium]